MKNTSRNVGDMPMIGKIKGKEIFMGDGKFGPYMKISGKSVKNMNISNYLKLVNKRVEDFTIEDAEKSNVISKKNQ